MQGYQLTFITPQDRRHAGRPLSEWLLQAARQLGIRGATLLAAAEGYGQHQRLHAAHFFELADQPVMVLLALDDDEWQRLSQYLRDEAVEVFYIKTPAEFGLTG